MRYSLKHIGNYLTLLIIILILTSPLSIAGGDDDDDSGPSCYCGDGSCNCGETCASCADCRDSRSGTECGRCGTYDDCGNCVGQHGCEQGSIDTQTCYGCGTQTSECREDCSFGPWSDCTGDGDDCSELCSYQGGHWRQNVGCCGDDGTDDCGVSVPPYLCYEDTEYENPLWYNAKTSGGDILYLGCEGYEYLADTVTYWNECKETWWEKTVASHNYICSGLGGAGSITECCGNENCLSSNGGSRVYTGGKLMRETTTYYCADDYDWTTDLDIKNQNSCNSAGYAWTGTLCCSEDDDSEEYYNDVNGLGGCFNKEVIWNGNIVSETADILAYKGNFHGCAVDKTNYVSGNEDLLQITDSHTGTPLITNHGYCDTLLDTTQSGVNALCSYTETWMATSEDELVLSRIGWSNSTAQQYECCPPDSCWDGAACVENQADDSSSPVYGNYRCINGQWGLSEIKYNWDKSLGGFCPSDPQCLVDPRGNSNNNNKPETFLTDPPMCINDGQFIGPYYCDDGNWTTRTKLLALQLLDLAKNTYSEDYTLFCDYFEDTLNYYNYPSLSGPITDYIGTSCYIDKVEIPCVNEFCVLRYGSNVAFGTSLNMPVNDTSKSFLLVFNQDQAHCNSYLNSNGNFDLCGNNIWYNHNIQSVIYSRHTLGAISWDAAFLNYIKSPLNFIINFIMSYIHGKPDDYSFIANTNLLDRLYAVRKGSKSAFVVMEENKYENGVYKDYVGVKYDGLGFDVCGLVTTYDETASCFKQDSTYYIASQRIGSEISPVMDAWKDLTAKLRIS